MPEKRPPRIASQGEPPQELWHAYYDKLTQLKPLIVDPLTGAMYNLTPAKIEQPLSAAQAQVVREGKGFLVVLTSQATDSERAAMVRVN